ncbi:MAG: TetR/AcrR family transcriptional regulator [Calditrichaeota bacterium]|nr:TetR/AcrR family transcriptional regulator [Calditrichota bacterium]
MFTRRQQEIVEAAIDLIAEDGIQNLTIKNLSRRIGVTEAAIYRHFESKLDILLAILTFFREQQTALFQSIQQQHHRALDRLKTFFIERFRQFTRKPALAAVIFSEEIFQNDPRLVKMINEIMDMTLKYVRGVILEGQSAAEIRTDISDEQLSLMALGGMRLLVARWHLSDHPFDLLQEGERLWEAIQQILEV